MERPNGKSQNNGRAVGVGDDGSFPASSLLLVGDHIQVLGVELGNHQRNI
jgi:hypothetical protein